MSTQPQKPSVKPNDPRFSSGPCTKFTGWSFKELDNAFLGRSHRAAQGKARLKAVIEKSKELLSIPNDYHVAIVPASDTGAVEMAMWSMLGQRGVDVFAWENFGREWIKDAADQLDLEDLRTFDADFGVLPDLSQAQPDRDIVFTWNGTTTGTVVPDADWIANDREGITICDATSAVFAYDMPWDKLDVTTWSWQKVLGSEAAHGMIVLSPRAVERLETYTPPRALPKIFRMTKGGKLNAGIFVGETINTPSMMATEDCLASLRWVEKIGGVKAMIARSQESADAVLEWVESKDFVRMTCKNPAHYTRTSVCVEFCDEWFLALSPEEQVAAGKKAVKLLDDEGAAYDCNNYRGTPTGYRIWCGGTVEPSDIKAVLPWLEWAYLSVKAEMQG